ncbi:hypothetical protein GQ457_09G020020 [Hibiscus cannabinus]
MSTTETHETYAYESAQEVLCTTMSLPRRPTDLARSRELGRRLDYIDIGKLNVGILSRNIPWGKYPSQCRDHCSRELREMYQEEM